VDQAEGVVIIDPAACQGCGSCASACPRKAIEVMHHRDDQFLSKIGAIQETVLQQVKPETSLSI
jgi:heterodisulfide reductase subunit A-like polyferredoxin